MKKFLKLYDEDRQTDQSNFEDCGGKYKPTIQGLSRSLADPWWVCVQIHVDRNTNIQHCILVSMLRVQYMSNLFVFLIYADVPDTYKMRGEAESDAGLRKACRFRRSWLGSCSGETDEFYGFKEGKPCLIVKLNRIVNFKPKVGLFCAHQTTGGVLCYGPRLCTVASVTQIINKLFVLVGSESDGGSGNNKAHG